MEKIQAQNLVRELLENPFQLEKFTDFVGNLLNKVEVKDDFGDSRRDSFKEHIERYRRIGKYIFPGSEDDELDVLVVETKSLAKLERARTSLRNFVVEHLKKSGKDYALAAFYAKEDGGADWRLSFVKVEQGTQLGDDGRVKIDTILSPARRYSFLVGKYEKSHTAQKQLLPLLERDHVDPTLAELEAAFGVEKVTDEFFVQYKKLYDSLKAELDGNSKTKAALEAAEIDTSRFAKKLLGQVVFLYFVQKKGWLGVDRAKAWGQGDRRFLRELFKQANRHGKEYYADSLQYLFYEALAKEDPADADPTNQLLSASKFPFLNGGLFEANYDWASQPISIPNALFSNDEKTKAGDQGTGILDVFDRYNFTIKEDEPLEKEVAVDPEMLGKVFENMLETEERKGKGAFYTPREIVHYMCQESLIHYLDNALNSYPTTYQEIDSPQLSFLGNEERSGQLKLTEEHVEIQVPKQDLEDFIRHSLRIIENDARVARVGRATRDYPYLTPESVRQHALEIDRYLDSIKICDPAIGSGAFPVGLLNEIIAARTLLTLYLDGYPVQEEDESLDAYQSRVDSWLHANKRTTYALKRHAIQESIYGVDIDASAIDIARLRLWLSLIVDEDDFEKIDALPNLDYKIVEGNSLIGFPEQSINIGAWGEGLREIEELKSHYTSETNHRKKLQLKRKIDEKIGKRLSNSANAFGYQINFDFRLFFSEVWRTPNRGFDIVIGNPPYVQIQKFSGKQIQKDWEKQGYKSFAKKGDLYCLFYEKGHRLLRNNGLLAFITSNKWMRAGYGQKMRQFLLNHTRIEQLIDFGDSPIFSGATTYTNILLFEKGARQGEPSVWDLSSIYEAATSLEQMLAENSAGEPSFAENAFIIVPLDYARIKARIEEVGIPVMDWDIAINFGIKTGRNEAFLISKDKRTELIASDPKSAGIIKPILRGRDIKRYQVDFANLWLLDTHNGYGTTTPINVADYPSIKSHLDYYWKLIKKRQDKGRTPYNLRNCAYHNDFMGPKIIWLEMSPTANFTYCSDDIFVLNTAYIMTGSCLKYLLAVLNSSVIDSYFPFLSTDIRGKNRRYFKQYVELIPVPEILECSQYFFENLVDYVLLVKPKNIKLQSAYFEQLIDGLVYELYFPDEIKAANKEILAHLGDLQPITDDMSDEAKLAIIQSEFERLYDPTHPVRNHLETLDSVEEVRIIQEALKK